MTTKAFKEMDPEVVQKLLEGHENVIEPEISKEKAFLDSVPCPMCHEFHCEPRVNSKRPFVKGQSLSNKLLLCLNCSTEFDPHSRIILKTPTASSD